MRKLLSVILGVLLVSTFAFADSELDQLRKQIADLQTQVDTMNKFVSKNTRHTATDKLSISAEFMTRLDSTQYKNVRALPEFASDMMGLWLADSLAQTDGDVTDGVTSTAWDSNGDGFNDAFMSNYYADFGQVMMNPQIVGMLMSMGAPDPTTDQGGYQAFAMNTFAGMLSSRTVPAQYLDALKTTFGVIKPKKYDTNNDFMLTNRLRLRLSSKVNENLSFSGRLTMFKTFGDSTPFHFFNGTMGSMALDANSAQVPTDDTLRVERAYFVYKNSIGDVHWHFSFGRRPAAYGYGMENHENAVLGGSPAGTIIQMNFDGGSLGFDLADLTGIPGLNVKFCYGQGYEGGYGTLNSMNAQADVNDVHFFGAIVKLFDNEDYKVIYNWAHGYGLTDGFIGTAVFPFYVSGNDYNLDGQYDEYTLNPNYGGFVSRVEPMSEVGNIDLHSIIAQGYTFDFSWFASYSMSKTDPTNRSANPMYQFMGMDQMMDGTGHMYWLGVMTPELPFLGGKLGVEYNHGTKYWQPFILTYDAQKLATRGDVYEVYYHQPIVGNNFFATLGYIHYDYEYTNSGNFMGEPVKIEDATAFNTLMPVVDKVDQFYLKMTYRF
ncbi:DUF3373 domain-containing protein [Deferribacterales bacterium Es71-Z0220]|uniref:DUF3373 family protein n=1 Tax=Deferrivibrio essentukiensis TaxID=2880922 RepID=UPI001F611D78|nr:DUF3373 family protein [Deferrivibrio essentukiensis]MCB4203620.1 DUF3373 domain-containing protein [Deferrivibrio essentukiensis]